MNTPSINTILGVSNDLATMFGVNNWQLQSGSYNGEFFYVVPEAFGSQVLGSLNNRFNPAAGIIDNVTGIYGTWTGNGPKDNSQLSYGNIVTTNQIVDSGKAKVVVYSPPNNQDIFEDMGFYGEEIAVYAIIAGPSYQTADYNFFSKALNPQENGVKPGDIGKFVHPVFGEIYPARLMEWKRIHLGTLWRANMWELKFRTAKPVMYSKKKADDLYTKITNTIGNVLAITQSILNTYSIVRGVISVVSNIIAPPANQSGLPTQQTVSTNAQYAANNARLGTIQITQNFAPSIYENDPIIKNATYDSVYTYPQMQYFNQMAPSDVNNMANTLYESINVAMESVNDFSAGNSVYPEIDQFKNLMAEFNNLISYIMSSYLGSTREYVVPYDMDMVTLCFVNDLDYESKHLLIQQLNDNIIESYNFIPKDITLTLPI